MFVGDCREEPIIPTKGVGRRANQREERLKVELLWGKHSKVIFYKEVLACSVYLASH